MLESFFRFSDKLNLPLWFPKHSFFLHNAEAMDITRKSNTGATWCWPKRVLPVATTILQATIPADLIDERTLQKHTSTDNEWIDPRAPILPP